MPTLDIIIRGVSLIYFKEGQFKVLFPFGNGHRVTLRVPGRNPVDLDQAGRQITVSGATSNAAPPQFGPFIDITGPNAHRNGVEVKKDWPSAGVLLSVPGAEFASAELSRSRYTLAPAGTNSLKTGAIIGYAARLRLSGPSFKFDITPPNPGDPLPISSDMEITFDNSCPICPASDENADFKMLYNVIVDAADKVTMFAQIRHDDDLPKPTPFESFLGLIGNSVFSFRPPPQNARIDNNNPEPKMEGLPCNVVIASNSKGLP